MLTLVVHVLVIVINPLRMRRRVTVVESHLTSGASVRPENTVTYSAGNGGQKICVVFSETAPLQRSSTALFKAIHAVGHFPAESMHAYLPHVQVACVDHELSFVSCHWSCFQAKSVHNGMNSWRRGFCTLVHSSLSAMYYE